MFAVCMALVSLPVAAEVWQPITAKGDLDYLVDSVHRIGTHVYLIDRGTVNSPQGPLKFEAPIEFDCSQHALRMAWGDVLVGGRAPQRSYGKSFGHYAAMPFVSAPASAYGEAILQWGCHLPVQPERLVNIGHSSGDKLIQIDTRSINKSGEYTSFWTRYDYPQIQFDPPYDAPYDSKREFVTVNCKTGRFRISVGYDFTPEGAVTDNMIARDDAETPIDSTDDYEVAIKAVACGKPVDPETYTGIGGETLRAKQPVSADVDIDSIPASPAVIAPAQSFYSILPDRPPFTTARIVETSKSSKLPTARVAIDIRPTAGNVERVREIYSSDFFVDRDMLGLVQLKSKMNMRSSESRTVYVAQSLTVNENTWKEGGEVSFVTESHNVPGQGEPIKYGLNCHIGSHVEAKVVNAGLDGYAWPLDCKRLNGDIAKGYYIEALGFFITTHEDSKDFGVSDTTVDSVTIER